MKIFYISLIAVLLFCHSALAAERSSQPVRLDLKTVLKLALEQNPSTLIGRENIQRVLAQVNEQKSILYPQITANISEKRRTTDLRASGITFAGVSDPSIGPYNTFDARVKVTQKIFDPALKKRLEWANQGQRMTETQSRKIEQDVLALAAAQYIQTVRAQHALEVVRAFLARDYRNLKLNHSQFELGTATDIELNQSRAQYLQSFRQGRDARREFMKSRLDLMTTLDLSPDQRVIVDNWSSADLEVYTVIDGESSSEDVNLAQEKAEMSKKLASSEKSEYWPKLALNADYGPSGEGPSSKDSSETYAFGVEASFPIFDAGGRRSRIKSAETERRINEMTLEDVKRRNQADITVSRWMLADAAVAIKDEHQQWRLAQERLDVAVRQFKIGTGNEMELLSSRAQLSTALDHKREAEALYLMSAVNLAHATGRLDEWVKAE